MSKTIISGKNIILGVCGGISAYKSVDLLRRLVKLRANIQVVMTENAKKFITPMTFEVLSSNCVTSNLFKENCGGEINHIKLAEAADAVVLAPATANTIAKIVTGTADDILSTMMLAVTCPVMICPSMNSNMYKNPITKKNMGELSKYGYFVMAADEGQLACGSSGVGRLPDPDEIVDRLTSYLTPNDMLSKRVLVTAGPTHEMIDPVRFISNPSSGKMGYAIACAAENRGAEVTLISGPVSIKIPMNVKIIKVRSADEMANEVIKRMVGSDVIIKVAAVSDYKPEKFISQKIKKDKLHLNLKLKKNLDILKYVGQNSGENKVIVGFAAESCDIYQNAKRKLKEKKLDMLVANLIGADDSGFMSDTNRVSIFLPNKDTEDVDIMDKASLAHLLLDRIVSILSEKDYISQKSVQPSELLNGY